MYLKSLEILGFKSFAAKTVLTFHNGVTCVVGPNGCGKSNVLDAIRWVLGEQSAKALRGGEMADVIFSGTDSRQALGMAEVSMTFDECEEALGLDWREVTITRRVFRDGGSEYLLNKTPCRLKDIHQLFMDTGIGRSAYSIMEQGKIDMILSSRPEDRRAIFEEAAGITKYKSQKKEALRKLEATDANLLRVADIIREVKRQIGSLQRQAGKARRYQALLGDLRLLETHHAKRQHDTLEEQRATTAEELTKLAEQQTAHEQEIEQQEGEVAVQRAALEEMERKLHIARQAVNEVRARISNHENRIVFNQERVLEFTGLVERYGAEVAGSEERLRIAETQLHETDAELAQITEMLAGELRRMEEKQAATAALTGQRAEAEQAINAAASEAARIESRLSGLRGQIASVLQQRDGAEARLAVLSSECEQLTAAFDQLAQQQTAAQAELERALASHESHVTHVTHAETALREEQAALGEVDRQTRETQKVLSEKESKLEVLRALNAGGEGFSEGTQAVLRGLDNPDFFRPAVLGALAQFIDVAPEFVTAVEAALGANLQTIVMKDTMVAESVIRTLSAQKLGRAALALRDFMVPGRVGVPPADSGVPPESFGLEQSVVSSPARPIRVLIRATPEVSALLDLILADTWLVPDLEAALACRRTGSGTFVTLAGEVLTQHGILHGGVSGEATNSVLVRKNQIAALETEESAVRAQLGELATRREISVAAIESASARLEEAREEKQSAALLVSTLRAQLSLLERERKDAERKHQSLDGERASSEARHAEAAARFAQLEIETAACLQQSEGSQQRRAEGQSRLEILRAQEAEVAGELNELKIKVATERQRHSSLHHQRAPMEARLGELRDLIVQRQADIAAYRQRAEATAAENAGIESDLEGLHSQAGEAELEVARQLDERANLAAAAEELGNTLRILRHQLSECHDQRSRLEVKATQLEMKLTALTEHMQKRYQLDLSTFERDLHGLRVSVRERKSGADLQSAQASEVPDAGESAQEPASSLSAAGAPDAHADHKSATLSDDAFAIDWDRVEALVRELDSKLDAMGPVNLDAIQEYDELEQRHTFLEQQNTDLINAKTELLDTIAKINQTTKVLFADTFEKIRANFSEMFTELFGGGKANLILTDESDPLESGIDIIAKPPGKQLQSISLLSGGEKTMTAVAMLFSIYMVKPSPFCVLDEMDAPLDESNINRFIKILDRFVAQSQFVVISHNKRTIARADAIYGVTMEEHGVSKLVGVKFSTRERNGNGGEDVLSSSASERGVPSVAETFGKHGNLASEAAEAVSGAA